MNDSEPSAPIVEVPSSSIASFFVATTRDTVQVFLTFSDSLLKYAAPIDPHLPFSIVRVISLAQNVFVKTAIFLLVLTRILDAILTHVWQLCHGDDSTPNSNHPGAVDVTSPPLSAGPQSTASPQSLPSHHPSAEDLNPCSARPDFPTSLKVEDAENADSLAADRANQTVPKVSALLQPTDQHVEALQPPSHPVQPSSSTDPANAHSTRREGDGRDADVNPLQEAPSPQPHRHPAEPIPLPPHSTSQAENTGATESPPPNSQHAEDPETAGFLMQLALSSLNGYLEGGGPEQLEESVGFAKHAVDLHPPGHPNRSTSLECLVPAIFMRYMQDRHEADLSECLERLEEVRSLQPPGESGSAARLSELVNTGLTMCEMGCGPSIWLGLLKKAHALVPMGMGNGLDPLQGPRSAPSRPSKKSGGWSESSEAAEIIREASTAQPPDQLDRSTTASITPDRLQAALHWINIATQIDSKPELDAYQSAFTHLSSALALGQSLQARQSKLFPERLHPRPVQGLALEAALYALSGPSADSKLAVELLDHGRSVLLASAGQLGGDLSDVKRQDPALAVRFQRISRFLELATSTGPEISEKTSSEEDPIRRYKRISADWNATVAKIRLLPGCQSFLLPVPYVKLQEAAMYGPVIVILVDKNRSTAIIVTPDDDPHTIHLPGATEDALRMLYEEMEHALSPNPNPTQAIHGMTNVLSGLWSILVQPIMQALKHNLRVPPGSRVWWYPTSWASFLPLHAAGSYKKSGLNALDLYVSSYTPTLQALIQSRNNLNSTSIRNASPLIVSQSQTPGQAGLDGADEEAGIVFSLVPDASLLADDQGTRESVLNALSSHSWIHLACHVVADPPDPFTSYFALHDGPLSLQDIIAKGLPSADFAFLSACHPAVRDRALPDEGLSLAGGMQLAGFNSVVGTLWKMADEDAPILADKFYKALATRSGDGRPFDCMKTAESLHDAVKMLREHSVPVFRWVNVVHYGI